MAERQIVHRKSSLVLSALFPVVKWRSRSVYRNKFTHFINFSKNITQTAITNMMKQRMFQKTKILKTYALSHHVCYRSLCFIFTEVYLCWYFALKRQ